MSLTALRAACLIVLLFIGSPGAYCAAPAPAADSAGFVSIARPIDIRTLLLSGAKAKVYIEKSSEGPSPDIARVTTSIEALDGSTRKDDWTVMCSPQQVYWNGYTTTSPTGEEGAPQARDPPQMAWPMDQIEPGNRLLISSLFTLCERRRQTPDTAAAQQPVSNLVEPNASTTESAVTPPVPPSPQSLVLNAKPVYPFRSRMLGEQGTVRVKALISATGIPITLQLLSSSSYVRLDQAALSTVAQWTFTPASRAGTPIESWAVVPIVYKLQDEIPRSESAVPQGVPD